MTPEIEKSSLETIKAFQEEKLRETISYIAKYSPYYKRLFEDHNIDPTSINTLEDLNQRDFSERNYFIFYSESNKNMVVIRIFPLTQYNL